MKDKRSLRYGWTSEDIEVRQPEKSHKANKSQSEDKVARVMREFSEGKLRSNGKVVTDRAQAIAIALSSTGLSDKSLKKAEIVSKAKVLKAQLHEMIQKEMESDKTLKRELIAYLKSTKDPKDSDVHAIAEKFQVSPSEVEQLIYRILAEFLSGGLSKGKILPVEGDELSMGIKTEMEHTKDKDVAEKIARDHLAEDPKYYSKLKEMESK